jgi:hypothetical protein
MTARNPSAHKKKTAKSKNARKVSNEVRAAPGEPVERSGIYEAFHASHRITQQLTLLAGHQFPYCSRCRERVRYALIKADASLNETNSPVIHVIGVFLPEAA